MGGHWIFVFPKLKRIGPSKVTRLGRETAGDDGNNTQAIAQRLLYSAEQKMSFYQSLPISLEALVIGDATTTMFNCIGQFFLSDDVPPRLKTLELTYQAMLG